MEIVPMLDAGCQAVLGMWYLLAVEGDGPSARVGHANVSCQCPVSDSCEKGDGASADTVISNLLIVGGATPSGPFNDVYNLELSPAKYKWSKMRSEGLTPRYEHGITRNKNGDIFVFGGAQQDGNLNTVQVLRKGAEKWEDVNPTGCLPAPRTCLNTATINNMLYVFGGGLQGAVPVSDTQVHVFDPDACTWTQLKCTGHTPSPRHGHVMLAFGKKIYVHGGMAERDIHGDLYTLDTDTNNWEEIKQSGDIPSSRAAHSGVVVDKFIYIFGGMNFSGALNDLYRFDIDFLVWNKVEIEGCPPPPRLDHTLSSITHFVNIENGEENDSTLYRKQQLLVSFGGMDTTGQIFDDVFAIAVA